MHAHGKGNDLLEITWQEVPFITELEPHSVENDDKSLDV